MTVKYIIYETHKLIYVFKVAEVIQSLLHEKRDKLISSL